MRTAFVLSGGASLGAVQVGMMRALAERGIRPDLLIGTSVGAVNASYLAGHGFSANTVEELADVWRALRRRRLFRTGPVRIARTLLGRNTSLFTNKGLRELVRGHLTFAHLEDAAIPLTVIATDLLSGAEVPLAAGPAMTAIVASCAIPGVLPPVRWGGRMLVDGGLADNTAISQAVEAGADTVYVLPCSDPAVLVAAPHSALGSLQQALTILFRRRVESDMARYAASVKLTVMRPPAMLPVSLLDFGHSAELIDHAYDAARTFLAEDAALPLPTPSPGVPAPMTADTPSPRQAAHTPASERRPSRDLSLPAAAAAGLPPAVVAQPGTAMVPDQSGRTPADLASAAPLG